MNKVIAPDKNCWVSWLACMMDLPVSSLEFCSTENEDWREKTEQMLERFDCYCVEVDPKLLTPLPHDTLVGANVNGATNREHIVVAKVVRDGDQQCLKVHHDPAQIYPEGAPIAPRSVVLICKRIA